MTATKTSRRAGTTKRSVAVETTVEEFTSWVSTLAEAAGIVHQQADAAAEVLTLEEAAQLYARLDECRGVVKASTDPLSRRIADLWEAGKDAVIEVADLEIKVHHRRDRREWDHAAIAREIVRRNLAARAAADQPFPTPYDVVEWLLEAELPSYWRKDVLSRLGIDVEKFSKGRDERPRGHARRRKTDDATPAAAPETEVA